MFIMDHGTNKCWLNCWYRSISLIFDFQFTPPCWVFRAMSLSPNLSFSSDCSTQIIIDQQNKQDKKLNIFENNLTAKNEGKEIVLSSKVALHDAKDIMYASSWNTMWLEVFKKLSKNWTSHYTIVWSYHVKFYFCQQLWKHIAYPLLLETF